MADHAGWVDAGSVADLETDGRLVTKVGPSGVCVFWSDGRPLAIDDRCPHLGFPLHRGTVEAGLVTCHWHHARFDLCSGGTLDPWADDVRTHPVTVTAEGRVLVGPPAGGDDRSALLDRLRDGLEQSITLVIAKAVLALFDAGVEPAEIVATGVDFGTRHRRAGWGAGLTVLTAMANLLPALDPADRPLALVQGLAFVARDTSGHPDRFPLPPLPTSELGAERLSGWYRRFIDTRSADAAERALATAVASLPRPQVETMLFAAATDHLFIDEGHSVDFTNKALESLAHVGSGRTTAVLGTVVGQTARARRHEEEGAWRHPIDLPALAAGAATRLAGLAWETNGGLDDLEVAALGRRLLDDEPGAAVDALVAALEAGATPEQAARAVALAAGLRITRFHVQNDHGDWDVVHHGFTYANAVHQAMCRAPSSELLRGVVHGALKVHLDRFLNIPAARLVPVDGAALDQLGECWDEQGRVDRAGGIVYGYLTAGGAVADVVAVLGRAVITEDAGFHWFQVVEAAVRQASAWPDGSDEAAQLLSGAARFLAAQTPSRRELPKVVQTAGRLRRGEALFEE